LPRAKEAPFFIYPEAAEAAAFEPYMRKAFAEASEGVLLGKATPDYMLGRGEVGLETVADRIANACPKVKLIALLRDPIERALSNHAMEVRRGQERRSADAALNDLLAADELAAARGYPTFVNSYVIQGEYARILRVFRSRFPAGQILVEHTRDLAVDPAGLLDRVLAFLGLPVDYRPEGLGMRHFRGGTRKRVDAEAEASLLAYLRREVLPHLDGDPDAHAEAFGFFFDTWNVIADDDPTALSDETRARLEEHFREDAERLVTLDVAAPWIAEWSARDRDIPM